MDRNIVTRVFIPAKLRLLRRHMNCLIWSIQKAFQKKHPGGLKGRRQKSKVVQHLANVELPSRCFVCLFKLHKSVSSESKGECLVLVASKKPTLLNGFPGNLSGGLAGFLRFLETPSPGSHVHTTHLHSTHSLYRLE